MNSKTPEPPDPFLPLLESIPAGTILYRVHEPQLPDGTKNDGTIPNPGYGKPSRFAFFGNPPTPVLYAADQPAGSVHESILHDAEPGTFIPGAQWRSKILTALEVTRDLQVASFHSDGLRRFGIYAKDLTDTDRTHYSATVKWAEAAWNTGAHGICYMSRHFNSAHAYCLFGDQLPHSTLQALPNHAETRVFELPDDTEWLASLALAIHVVLRP